MTNPTPTPRWFHLTPDRLILGLLAVEGLLWLSERFGWLAWHKGYAVLAALASVGVAMMLMLAWFAIALIFRWRFQFSIRSLLVLVVVVAVPCSWLAVEMKKAREQQRAVKAIQQRGGTLAYDYQFQDGHYNYWPVSGPVPRWIVSWLDEDIFYKPVLVNLNVLKPTSLSSIDAYSEIDRCRSALRVNPNDVQANCTLAGIFLSHPHQPFRDKHRSEARQCAERVLRCSNPNSVEYAHAKKLLAGEKWTFEELCRRVGPDGVLR
jgi:hypothetical protein